MEIWCYCGGRVDCEVGVTATRSRIKLIFFIEIRDGSGPADDVDENENNHFHCFVALCAVSVCVWLKVSVLLLKNPYTVWDTHVPLSTLIAHMGKLQNRQLHFKFASGCFYTKIIQRSNRNRNMHIPQSIFLHSLSCQNCLIRFLFTHFQRATLKVMSPLENW